MLLKFLHYFFLSGEDEEDDMEEEEEMDEEGDEEAESGEEEGENTEEDSSEEEEEEKEESMEVDEEFRQKVKAALGDAVVGSDEVISFFFWFVLFCLTFQVLFIFFWM